MGDFDALLLAVTAGAVSGAVLGAVLAVLGVLTVKVDLKRPAQAARRTTRKQAPEPEAEWDPEEPPF